MNDNYDLLNKQVETFLNVKMTECAENYIILFYIVIAMLILCIIILLLSMIIVRKILILQNMNNRTSRLIYTPDNPIEI